MSETTGVTDAQIAAAARRLYERHTGDDVLVRPWEELASSQRRFYMRQATHDAGVYVPPGYRIVGPGVELFVRCETCKGGATVINCLTCNGEGVVPLEGATNE
jgi:hypothetical protein